jgi:hypothetical protein
MIEILAALKRALQEDNAILHFEGHIGGGQFLAIVMALCPGDVTVQVENEIVIRGKRERVVVSFLREQQTRLGIRTLLRNNRDNFLDHIVQLPTKINQSEMARLRWDGYLATSLDIALGEFDVLSSERTRFFVAELISVILFTIPFRELGSGDLNDGLMGSGLEHTLSFLLGPFAKNRVRDTLKTILGAERTFIEMDCKSSLDNLTEHISRSTLDRFQCPKNCPICHGRQSIDVLRNAIGSVSGVCPVRDLWCSLGHIVTSGVVAPFVTPTQNCCVSIQVGVKARGLAIKRSDVIFAVLNRVAGEDRKTKFTLTRMLKSKSTQSGAPRVWTAFTPELFTVPCSHFSHDLQLRAI